MLRPPPDPATATSAAGTATVDPLLSVEDLRLEVRTRGQVARVLNGVTFDVRRGERLGIVGESGSGKSLTALTILGLVDDAVINGSIRFDGVDMLSANEQQLRAIRGKEIGYVFQDPLTALNPVRTIGVQVMDPLVVRGVSKAVARRRSADLLGRVGLKDAAAQMDLYPHQFSGGMRQRVMIAMALVAEPQLLIADEPTTALDVRVQAKVLELMLGLAEERQLSLMLITHNLAILSATVERVIVMYAGRVVEACETDELFYSANHPYTLGLLRSLPSIEGPIPDELITIGGYPPPPTALPTGCPFHPRCAYAEPICYEITPTLRAPTSGPHLCACHRAEWVSQQPAMLP